MVPCRAGAKSWCTLTLNHIRFEGHSQIWTSWLFLLVPNYENNVSLLILYIKTIFLIKIGIVSYSKHVCIHNLLC